MKTLNKFKPINKLISELVVFLIASFFLTKDFVLKLNLKSFWVLLWLIILFSISQLKSKNEINKMDLLIAGTTTLLIFGFAVAQHRYYFASLSIITMILMILKTPKNEQLNHMATQIGFWIFGLCEAAYSLTGFLTLSILNKTIIVFVTNFILHFFLNKRKITFYISLCLIGFFSLIIFKQNYLYLLLQIIVPLIPRSQKKEEPIKIWELLYRILSYLLI